MNPLWSYDDRGYYSMAFISRLIIISEFIIYLMRINISGYIFLYMVFLRILDVPTPSVQYFKHIMQEVKSGN